MSRLSHTFQSLADRQRKALIPFVTAGDPAPQFTVQVMHTLVKAGADVIELGVPFSDPMADGPTIQRASERALRHGVGLRQVLGMVKAFRAQDTETPVVLMGYANPIECMGYETFAEAAATAGVDGVLTVDYPPEESADYAAALQKHGLDPIFLLAPTTPESRLQEVGKLARGFVYYVSLKGVTGAATLDLAEVARKLPAIRAACGLPIGVGFGIRDGETARQIAGIADAVVVGSRIVKEMENEDHNTLLERVDALVSDLRRAIDA